MGECKRYEHGQVSGAHPAHHWRSAGYAQTATGTTSDSRTAANIVNSIEQAHYIPVLT